MQQQQSQHSSNILEMKSIFQLFDAENNQEIDIKQINHLLRELEILGYQETKNSMTPIEPSNRPQSKEAQYNQLPPMQPGRRLTHQKKVNSSDNLEEQEKLNKTGQVQSPNNQQDSPQQSPTYISITELKYFPNNKTTMSFADFCDIFNECMQNKDQHDELLQSAFAVFDFDKKDQAILIQKKLKKYLKNSRIVQQKKKFKVLADSFIFQDVLKFCGVVNDRMTLNEFKEFFRKNL